MLALQNPAQPSSTSNPQSLIPHLLPTRINHTGPIRISKRYWNPQRISKPSNAPHQDKATSTETRESHFRGRRLLSRPLHLPKNYKGYVVVKTNDILPAGPSRREEERETHDAEKVMMAEDLEQVDEDEDEDDDNDDDEDPMLKIMLREKKRAAQRSSTTNTTTTAAAAGAPSRQPPATAGPTTTTDEAPTKTLKVRSTFDEICLWGHESVAGDEDVFVRGVEEWIGFAEVVNSH